MRAFRVVLPSGAGYWTVLDEDLSVVGVRGRVLASCAVRARWCGVDDEGVCGRDRVVPEVVRAQRAGLACGGGAVGAVHDVAGACRPGRRRGSAAGRGRWCWRAGRGAGAVGAAGERGADGGARDGRARGRERGRRQGIWCRCCYEVADDRDLPEAAAGEDGRTGWRLRARHRLHEPERPVDRAADADIVALLGACRSARDRLIVLLMARAGLRRGEVLGLRRSDVHLLADSRGLGCEVARAHLHVVRREDNPNGAVAKSRRQRAVPLDFVDGAGVRHLRARADAGAAGCGRAISCS